MIMGVLSSEVFDFSFQELEVLVTQAFHLLGFTYTKLFYIIYGSLEGCCFPSFFLSLLIICGKEGYYFVWVNFMSSHFAEVAYQLREISGRIAEVHLFIQSYHLQIVIHLHLPFQAVSPWSSFVVYCSTWNFKNYMGREWVVLSCPRVWWDCFKFLSI